VVSVFFANEELDQGQRVDFLLPLLRTARSFSFLPNLRQLLLDFDSPSFALSSALTLPAFFHYNNQGLVFGKPPPPGVPPPLLELNCSSRVPERTAPTRFFSFSPTPRETQPPLTPSSLPHHCDRGSSLNHTKLLAFLLFFLFFFPGKDRHFSRILYPLSRIESRSVPTTLDLPLLLYLTSQIDCPDRNPLNGRSQVSSSHIVLSPPSPFPPMPPTLIALPSIETENFPLVRFGCPSPLILTRSLQAPCFHQAFLVPAPPLFLLPWRIHG